MPLYTNDATWKKPESHPNAYVFYQSHYFKSFAHFCHFQLDVQLWYGCGTNPVFYDKRNFSYNAKKREVFDTVILESYW